MFISKTCHQCDKTRQTKYMQETFVLTKWVFICNVCIRKLDNSLIGATTSKYPEPRTEHFVDGEWR